MSGKSSPARRRHALFGAVGLIGVLGLPGAGRIPADLPLPTLPSLPGLSGLSTPKVPTPKLPSVPQLPTLPKPPSPAAPPVLDLGSLLGTEKQPAPTAADFRAMGSTHAANGKLHTDCHAKSWSFTLHPPSDAWTVEIFLIDPQGTNLASDALMSGADGDSGTKQFNICSENTTTGTFTIKAKMNYKADNEQYSGWMKSSTFKMSKP